MKAGGTSLRVGSIRKAHLILPWKFRGIVFGRRLTEIAVPTQSTSMGAFALSALLPTFC